MLPCWHIMGCLHCGRLLIYIEALDGGESGGIECGIALRVACGGAWATMAAAVICSGGYQCLLCRQMYQGLAGKSSHEAGGLKAAPGGCAAKPACAAPQRLEPHVDAPGLLLPA